MTGLLFLITTACHERVVDKEQMRSILPLLQQDTKETIVNKSISKLCVYLAVFILLVATGSTLWAGDWKILGEKEIKSIDQGISFENGNIGRVKKIKISVKDADVKITKLTVKYRMRQDDEFTNISPLKAGGQITPIDLPGARAKVRSVIVDYEILGGKESAEIKLWGL